MKYFLLTFLMASSITHAEYLVQGATIITVSSISDNKEEFAVKTSGGTGGCATGNWIIFKEANMSSSEALARSYSAALGRFCGWF